MAKKLGWLDYLFGYGKVVPSDDPRAPKTNRQLGATDAELKEHVQKGQFKKAQHKSKGGPLSLGVDQLDALRKANLERAKAQKAGRPDPRARRGLGATEGPLTQPSRARQHAGGRPIQTQHPNPDRVPGAIDAVTDFVPGVGEAKDVARAAGNIAKGNYGAAAIDAAAAAAGVVPVVGDVAAKGIRNFHGFERAQQRVPDLVPDQKTWNQVNADAQAGKNIEIGPITRRDREGKGGGKDKIKGQAARNAAVIGPDGQKIPVVVVPHKDPNKKWHIITTRDRGRDGKNTGVLGGREYNKGGEVTPMGGK